MILSPASISCRRPSADRLLYRALAVSAGTVAAILALILVYLTAASAGLLFADAGLWGLDWHPSLGAYGLLAMLAGSVAVSVLALLIAVPPGLVLAVWGRFFAPPWLGGLQSLRQCPIAYRQAAAALALSRWGFVRRILLPFAAPGIALGVVLASGRALAETAVLLFTAGYVTRWPGSWFDSGRTLAVHIYDLAMNVSGGSPNAAATALVLLVLAIGIQAPAVALGRISRGASR